MNGIFRKSLKSKKKIASIVLCALLIVNIFGAGAEKNGTAITLSIDGVEASYTTDAATIGEFLENEGILVKDNDIMSHSASDTIENGMYVSVDVAKYITVYEDNGEVYSSITYADTVEEVLADFDHPLIGYDSVYPGKADSAYDGMILYVTRVKSVTLVKDGGKNAYYTYSKTVGDFLEEAGFTVESDEVVVPSEDTPLYGTMTVTIKKKVTAMSPLDFDVDLSKARVITCEATAYTAAADECWPYADGLTATGVPCQVGVVAVDPRVIPLKTKLYIETADGSFIYGYCTAEDTGGAIKGNKIDLAMNTKAECFQFGRRQVKVYILS